jgi:hypothetical protein
MRAVSLRALLAVMMIGACVAQAGTAGAGCGDVTADEDVTASDALTVLRRAVGQSVELSCTYEDVMLDSTRPAGDEVGLISGYNPDRTWSASPRAALSTSDTSAPPAGVSRPATRTTA